eukprot:4102394-Alexandrium_andersonii.AAC.1
MQYRTGNTATKSSKTELRCTHFKTRSKHQTTHAQHPIFYSVRKCPESNLQHAAHIKSVRHSNCVCYAR